MTAATIQTFGATTTIQSRLPQADMEGTGDLLTTAVLAQFVNEAAAEVCGVLLSCGIVPADIAAETTSVAYYQCQRLVVDLAVPSIMRALNGLGIGVQGDIEQAETRARARLERIESNPTLLGWDTDTDVAPGAYSTVTEYDALGDSHEAVKRVWQSPTDGSSSQDW